MKNIAAFFYGGHSLLLLLSVFEFICLLFEVSEMLVKGLTNNAVLLFFVGMLGILLVHKFFEKSLGKAAC